MKERLKMLRKTIGMTQQEFADKIGISRGNIAAYEVGKNSLSDAAISLICKTSFSNGTVSENWLRTGEGEMFNPVSRNDEIARLTKTLLNDESDSFKNRFISMLANLTEDEWELLERKALELFEGRDGK